MKTVSCIVFFDFQFAVGQTGLKGTALLLIATFWFNWAYNTLKPPPSDSSTC